MYSEVGDFVILIWVFSPIDLDVELDLVGVSVWKFLIFPFGDLISPLGLLLPHLRGIFLYSLIYSHLHRWHHHCHPEFSSLPLSLVGVG